jgi:glutamate-1-semialdehyde aminotransferase
LADTRAVVGFRLPWKELVCPIIAPRALGAKVWDVDGNEYIDLTMGFGVNLFGHSPAFITAALEEQLRQGIHIGPQSPLAGQVAQLVSELTGMERVTFCNTGSEAVMTALRLARAATRRTRFAVFAGSYHGNFEEVLLRAQAMDGRLQAVPIAPGIPAHLLKDVLVLEYDRPESLALLQAQAHELAAVLV